MISMLKPSKLRVGEWVLIHFPQDETVKQCKLPRPWHGPYQITSCDNPDTTAIKVFFPGSSIVHLHFQLTFTGMGKEIKAWQTS